MGEIFKIRLMAEQVEYFKDHMQTLDFGLQIALKWTIFAKNDFSPEIHEYIKRVFNTWYSANHHFLSHKKSPCGFICLYHPIRTERVVGETQEPVDKYLKEWLKEYSEEKRLNSWSPPGWKRRNRWNSRKIPEKVVEYLSWRNWSRVFDCLLAEERGSLQVWKRKSNSG